MATIQFSDLNLDEIYSMPIRTKIGKVIINDWVQSDDCVIDDYINISKLVAEDLNLTSPIINIVDFNDFHRGVCASDGEVYVSYLFDGADLIDLLAHELRHSYQIKHKMFINEKRESVDFLDFSDEGNTQFQKYLDRESEIDARNYAQNFLNKYFKLGD